MPPKVLKTRIGHLTMKAIFRHKWDTPEDQFTSNAEYKTKHLGFFFKRHLAVGTKKRTGRTMFTKDNLFPIYTIGLSLLYAKVWLEFSWRVRSFNTPKNKAYKAHVPFDGC